MHFQISLYRRAVLHIPRFHFVAHSGAAASEAIYGAVVNGYCNALMRFEVLALDKKGHGYRHRQERGLRKQWALLGKHLYEENAPGDLLFHPSWRGARKECYNGNLFKPED